MAGDFRTIVAKEAATPWEIAHDYADWKQWKGYGADEIRDTRDPWNTAARLLPPLAFDYSVDIWKDTWPELKKREAIAASPRLHRLKGTEQGLREAITLAGGELLKVVTPPAKTFLSPNTTPEQRAEFLSRYPQLRIYPKRSIGEARGLFPGSARSFHNRYFPVKSEAFFRALPRAFMWDHGAETELTVLQRRYETETLTVEERVELRMRAARRLNHYDTLANRRIFTLTATAARRIFTVHTRTTLEVPGETSLARRVVYPSLDPINVLADSVAEQGIRKVPTLGRAFPGARWFVGFPQHSRAKERVYRRTYLFDPSRPLKTKGATTFLGVARLGIPPHNAELTVRVRGKQHPFRVQRFVAGFVMHRPKEELAFVKRAIVTHKRLSDRILISTKTTVPVKAGVGTTAGVFLAGELTQET